jgi:Domain of unknown function (DUF4123)
MDYAQFCQALWPQGNLPNAPQAYAILDGARDDAIAPAIWRSQLPYTCLYAGELSREMQLAAPYLVQLTPESRFTQYLHEHGWGHAWGIFAVAHPDVTLKVLRKHFRSLLQVRTEDGKVLVFRYYDPRVLCAFWPTCDEAQKAEMIGPLSRLLHERSIGDAHHLQELWHSLQR